MWGYWSRYEKADAKPAIAKCCRCPNACLDVLSPRDSDGQQENGILIEEVVSRNQFHGLRRQLEKGTNVDAVRNNGNGYAQPLPEFAKLLFALLRDGHVRHSPCGTP